MGPPSYMRSVVDRNVVMRRMTCIWIFYVSFHSTLPHVSSVNISLHQVGYWYTKRVKKGEASPYTQ